MTLQELKRELHKLPQPDERRRVFVNQELFDAIHEHTPLISRYHDQKLSEEGYENIIAGWLSPIFVLEGQ